MTDFSYQTDSYCNPPKRDLYETDKEVWRQLYIETAKNKKVLEKLHHKILQSFAKDSSLDQNWKDAKEIENFSKVDVGIVSKISYLLTGSPIDYDVISSTELPYHAVDRCDLLAKMFEEKYKDFPLVLECSYVRYSLGVLNKDVKLNARIKLKDL